MSRKCRLLTVGIIAVGKIVLNGGREKKLICTRISLIRHFYPRLIIEVQHFTQVLLNCNLSFPTLLFGILLPKNFERGVRKLHTNRFERDGFSCVFFSSSFLSFIILFSSLICDYIRVHITVIARWRRLSDWLMSKRFKQGNKARRK